MIGVGLLDDFLFMWISMSAQNSKPSMALAIQQRPVGPVLILLLSLLQPVVTLASGWGSNSDSMYRRSGEGGGAGEFSYGPNESTGHKVVSEQQIQGSPWQGQSRFRSVVGSGNPWAAESPRWPRQEPKKEFEAPYLPTNKKRQRPFYKLRDGGNYAVYPYTTMYPGLLGSPGLFGYPGMLGAPSVLTTPGLWGYPGMPGYPGMVGYPQWGLADY